MEGPSSWKGSSSGVHRHSYVLGPVPGVDVMAKRSQELLNVRTLSARTLGCFRAHLREQRGGRFTRLQGDALGGPGPAWVQLGPPLARGAPVSELTAASSTTGASKARVGLCLRPLPATPPAPRPCHRQGPHRQARSSFGARSRSWRHP